MATHSSTLAWKIPCTEEPGGGGVVVVATVHRVAKSRTRLSDFTFTLSRFRLPTTCWGYNSDLYRHCPSKVHSYAWWDLDKTVESTLLFNCSVTSDSLQSHGLQHTRLPYPSLSPRVCSNSCPLSQWCHSTISSSVAPFSSCPQSFPASVVCDYFKTNLS